MGRTLGILIFLTWAAAGHGDWMSLNRFQETITRAEFDSLLTNVYCPSGAITNYLSYTTNAVTIYSTPDRTNTLFTLRFGAGRPPVTNPAITKVCLDPGHIGGEWARTEERFFVRGKDRPVQEAALNLTVARILRDKLKAAGCEVVLTKNNFQPVTDKRPEDYREEAGRSLPLPGASSELDRDAWLGDMLRKRMEVLFYRHAEIAARARLVNEIFKPALTICIHFNAVEWNERNDLVDDNRLVVFVHGDYLPAELTDDFQKQRLVFKLLERSHATELSVAESIANSLALATKLPAVQYGPTGNAVRVGTNSYLYARNLAASRLMDGPVVFLEPYYMNNKTVYQRIQLGDYDGEKTVDGKSYPSIFREYAAAVFAGLQPFLPPHR